MSVTDSYIPKAHPARLRCAVVPGKVVVVYGPRRVGKTASVRRYVQEYDRDALVVTGEDVTVRAFLESQLLAKLKAFVGGRWTLIVDETQYVRQIGLNLKLSVDLWTGCASLLRAHRPSTSPSRPASR